MNDVLTKHDMEIPRRPSELAVWFKAKYSEIRNNPEEVAKARIRMGLYKHFIQEIYPLTIFTLWRFPQNDVLCKPVIGNQGHDAEIFINSDPKKVFSIEVTWPQDGRNHIEVAKIMNNHGVTSRVGDEFTEYNQNIFKRIIGTAEKKAIRDYRTDFGSALLIVMSTECSPLDKIHRLVQIDALLDDIRKISFKSNSVYLITTPHEGVYTVFEQPTKGSSGRATARR
mgnify:CR=1 FL=1